MTLLVWFCLLPFWLRVEVFTMSNTFHSFRTRSMGEKINSTMMCSGQCPMMRVITNSTLSGGSRDSPEGLGHPTKRTHRTSVHYEGVIIDKTWERKIQKICGM